MFKRSICNWGVPFQYHGSSGASCGVVHVIFDSSGCCDCLGLGFAKAKIVT